MDAALSPMLRCEGLVKRFGDRLAVDDVSFQIAPGEFYGLLGPNGAGKTTTILMLCGLLRAEAGKVWVAGQPLDDRTVAARAAIGYVPQDLALYPDLTAAENLRFFGRLYGLSGRLLARRVEDVLADIGLADRARDRVDSFSGGMKRRLNIGASLLHEPRLLVLDEPTVGVDPQSRHAILESVEALGAAGMAVLYTTHYMEEAQRLCHRVGIIDRGRLVAEGTQRELVALVGGLDRLVITASGPLAALSDAARQVAGVERADVTEAGVTLLCKDGHELLPRVLELAAQVGARAQSVDLVEPDLEAVFLHLTGTALRE